MNSPSVCVVAEVENGQVEEVDDQNNLRPDEVTANEEHDPSELQEVVEDEMAPDSSGCLDMVAVLGEEVPDVAELGDEEEEPAKSVIFAKFMIGETNQ